MKKEDLIAKLQTLPDGIDIGILDVRKNFGDASGDPSSVGVYPDFEMTVHTLEPDEAEFHLEQEGEPFVPFATLDIENDDYTEDGKPVEK